MEATGSSRAGCVVVHLDDIAAPDARLESATIPAGENHITEPWQLTVAERAAKSNRASG
jgi:hypothetical protein